MFDYRSILPTYAAQLISVAASFICAILGARMLGPEGQGALALYTNGLQMALLLSGLGLPAALVPFIASGRLIRSSIPALVIRQLLFSLSGIFIVLVCLQISGCVTQILPTFFQLTSWKIFLLLHVLFLLLNTLLQALLQAEGAFIAAARITSSASLLLLIFYLPAYFNYLPQGLNKLNWILWATGACVVYNSLLCIGLLYRKYPAYRQTDASSLPSFRPLIQFALLAWGTNILQFLSYKMDLWFVHAYHGKGATGVYALAGTLAQMGWLLPQAMQSVLYTRYAAEKSQQENIQRVKNAIRFVSLYAVGMSVGGYVLSLYLVPVLFGSSFQGAISCIGILLWGIGPFCLSMPVSAWLAASGRVVWNLHAACIGFIVCLLLDVLWIPSWGIQGAAWASVSSYLSTLAYQLFRFRQYSRSFRLRPTHA